MKIEKFKLEISLEDLERELQEAKENNEIPAEVKNQKFGNTFDGYIFTLMYNSSKMMGKSYNGKVIVFNTLVDEKEPFYFYNFAKKLCDKYNGDLVATVVA